MITTLRAGLHVRLPSGNLIILLRREGAAWVCEYLPGARQRGEVDFLAAYLRKFGDAPANAEVSGARRPLE